MARIRIIQTCVGGGFGGKARPSIYPICAALACKAGRPARIVSTREEELIAGLPEPVSVLYLRIGVSEDGTLIAKESRVLTNNGAYTNVAPINAEFSLTLTDNLYRLSNVRGQVDLIYTNTTPTGMYRGPGGIQSTYAQESLLDIIAERLGIDPVELTLKNAVQKGDVSIHGYRFGSCGLSECITRSAKGIAWEQNRAQKQRGRGVGVACYVHLSGGPLPIHGSNFYGSGAIVRLDGEARATVAMGEPDIGQGARTIMAQIAAEELGLPIEDVDVSMVDTSLSPFGSGTWGSRVTTTAGNAVKLAAADARRQLLDVAAEMLEANAEDLDLGKGKVSVIGSPDTAIPVINIARVVLARGGGATIEGRGSFVPSTVEMPGEDGYGNVSLAYPFATHAAEVEVDTQTGQVKILKLVAAHDLGRAINPMLSEGQIDGGVAQGMGYALTEQLVEVDGRVLNPNLADYKTPIALGMPPIESILVEPVDPGSPLGVKGLGEVTLVPTPAAIANAVYDAVGVRIKEPPITPEKVLKALREKSGAVGL